MKLKEAKGQIQIKDKYIKKHGRLPKEKKDIGISIDVIRDYFANVKYRGIYFITIKHEASIELRKANYSFMQIGEILDAHYSTIINLVNRRIEDVQCFEVKYKWKELVEQKMYPVTVSNYRWIHEKKEHSNYISYVLVEKSELLSYI
jgi:hypothetical protein